MSPAKKLAASQSSEEASSASSEILEGQQSPMEKKQPDLFLSHLQEEPVLLLEFPISSIRQNLSYMNQLYLYVAQDQDLLNSLLEIREKVEEHGLHISIERCAAGILVSELGSSSSEQENAGDFLLIQGNFTPAHAEYIFKYIFPGRFSFEKAKWNGKDMLKVIDQESDGLFSSQNEPFILFFPEKGITWITSEKNLIRLYPSNDPQPDQNTKCPWQHSYNRLPPDAAVKIHLSMRTPAESPLAGINDVLSKAAAVDLSYQPYTEASLQEKGSPITDRQSSFSFHAVLRITPVNPLETEALAAQLSSYFQSLYTHAATQTQIPAELLHAFTVQPDLQNHAVQLDIRLKDPYASDFLELFFNAVQQEFK